MTSEPETPQWPEHEKLKKVQSKTQAILEFLDLSGYTLAEIDSYGYLQGVDEQTAVAEFFGIDMKLIEHEKQQMLEQIREDNAFDEAVKRVIANATGDDDAV